MVQKIQKNYVRPPPKILGISDPTAPKKPPDAPDPRAPLHDMIVVVMFEIEIFTSMLYIMFQQKQECCALFGHDYKTFSLQNFAAFLNLITSECKILTT
uniref:Uncharacterized protein n=1 Tax=Romanomermis culicivorax TaxID=13658 RepID=A0A915I5I3_ROMCU